MSKQHNKAYLAAAIDFKAVISGTAPYKHFRINSKNEEAVKRVWASAGCRGTIYPPHEDPALKRKEWLWSAGSASREILAEVWDLLTPYTQKRLSNGGLYPLRKLYSQQTVNTLKRFKKLHVPNVFKT